MDMRHFALNQPRSSTGSTSGKGEREVLREKEREKTAEVFTTTLPEIDEAHQQSYSTSVEAGTEVKISILDCIATSM